MMICFLVEGLAVKGTQMILLVGLVGKLHLVFITMPYTTQFYLLNKHRKQQKL